MKSNLVKKALSIALASTVLVTGIGSISLLGTKEVSAQTNSDKESYEMPKYVFMFVGDGMSHSQTQLTNYYLDALANDPEASILKSENRLSFMDYDSVGITTTYDSTSFNPDSASTATSLATGKKTYSGTINMDETFTVEYETIAEKLKEQHDYKIGVVSSVTLNHATPAAYYAHNVSRNNYYEIGLELIESDFDYFAGGALNQPTGKNKDLENLYELAEEAGYEVVLEDQDAAEDITSRDGKVIIIGEDTNGGALPYENDREEDMWALADYVEKGIEVLDNEDGFFMMVEAGKIDWACHANDAKASISDTIAFDNAIKEAYEFYEEHPEETLIVVTGDHETGGLTIGYAGTAYDTFLDLLENQSGSYDVFEAEYTEKYKAEKTPFETVLQDIKSFFGLSVASDYTMPEGSKLIMTDYEVEKIRAAYEVSVNGGSYHPEEASDIYGGYDPLTVTVIHILNNKSGIDFTSYSHTGTTVGTYAQGVGSDLFDGFYDNTEIYESLAELLNIK